MEVSRILDELAGSEDKLPMLTQLQSVVRQMSEEEIVRFFNKQRLDDIITCLNTDDLMQARECVETLEVVLDGLPVQLVFESYEKLFLDGIFHELIIVRQLCLTRFITALKCGISKPVSNVIKLLIERGLPTDDLDLASFAIKSLVSIASNPNGLNFVFDDNVLTEIRKLDWNNDILRFRIYELFVKLVDISHQSFLKCCHTGILAKLVKEVDNEDPLIRMNCVELLIQLQRSTDGWSFLQTSNILSILNSILVNAENDPLSSFVVPRILVFYGHLAHFPKVVNFIEVNEKYPAFMENTLSHILSGDPTSLYIALDTFAAVASCNQGRHSLLKFCKEKQVHEVISRIGRSIVATGDTTARLRALDALTEIFSDFPTESLYLSCLQDWYFAIDNHSSVARLLQKLSSQPFPDIRSAALKLLTNVAQFEWTQKDINSQAGMIEFLLDRKVEQNKSCVEAKYDVVVTLASSRYAHDIFSDSVLMQLQQYVAEGPFFVTGEANVAMDAN